MQIIAGGTVVDGTGEARRVADVAIEGDSIVAVGDLSQAEGERIDATGLFVTPGFIDLHTHSDASILANPAMSSSVHQGVTTELCGNCGMQIGLALDTPEFALERRLSNGAGRFAWSSLAEYLDLVERQGTAANVAMLAGHNTLRKRVMGWEAGPPDAEALRRMREELRRALQEGAFGFSTGLEYAPGRFSPTGELVELAREVATVGGLYATHLRDEAGGLVDSVEEALLVARDAGVALQLSHHKAEGRANWGAVERTLAMMEDARHAGGVDVACDVYPYTAFMTGLGVRTLPDWAQEGSFEEVAQRLQASDYRARVLAEMQSLDLDWERMQIAIATRDTTLPGRSLADIARERGVAPQEAVVDILASERGLVTAIYFEISEEDMRTVIRDAHASIISDSASRAANGAMAKDRIHPRGFGTFPRVLGEYVRREGVLSWEGAIHRMTGMPAARLGLRRRGVLRPGAYADIVVFDPELVLDRATYADPFQYPYGVRHVFVNGVEVIRNGEETGARPGHVLRRGAAE